MPHFTCLFGDDRYAVPSLAFEFAADADGMRARARAQLAANGHYQQVEVRDGDDLLFVETRLQPIQPSSAAPADD